MWYRRVDVVKMYSDGQEKNDRDQGPHYIPELDPKNARHPKGAGEHAMVGVFWVMIAIGFAAWVAAGLALSAGMTSIALALFIAGAVIFALIFPIVSLFG